MNLVDISGLAMLSMGYALNYCALWDAELSQAFILFPRESAPGPVKSKLDDDHTFQLQL